MKRTLLRLAIAAGASLVVGVVGWLLMNDPSISPLACILAALFVIGAPLYFTLNGGWMPRYYGK